MSISAIDAAAYLCRKSEWTIPNTRLHKILYLCQLNKIGKSSTPLIDDMFYASDFGPILPQLHKKCSCFGARPIQNIFWGAIDPDDAAKAWLDLGYTNTKSLTGGQLVAATHREPYGAWAKHYTPGAHVLIPNADIAAEYTAILTLETSHV